MRQIQNANETKAKRRMKTPLWRTKERWDRCGSPPLGNDSESPASTVSKEPATFVCWVC